MKTLFASPDTWRKMEALALTHNKILGRYVRPTADGIQLYVKDDTALRLSRLAIPGESISKTLARVIDIAYAGGMQ